MMDRINYIEEDNIKYMRSLEADHYDLAIADPEQGKEMHGGKYYSGNQIQKNGAKTHVTSQTYEKSNWDYSPPSPRYFDELIRVSKHQIIWGVQYYDRYFGPGRIVWDKINDGSSQFSCELAYTSLTDRVELFRYMWRGMMQGKSMSQGHVQQGNKKLNVPKIHPTQKPVALYAWLLKHFKIPLDWKIFDPNLGSGSIGIACLYSGHALDACENDTKMYLKALNWLNSERVKHEALIQF